MRKQGRLRHGGGNPAVARGGRAPQMRGVVAAEIDRQALLLRFGKQLDVPEFVVFAVEGRRALGEQQSQRRNAFHNHVPAMHPGLRIERLELLAVGADADTDLHAAIAEMIERGDLLGHHHDVTAHRQHQHAGAEAQPLCMRREVRVRDQRLPEARRNWKLRTHVVLRGHMIVAPHRMVTQRFRVLGDPNQILGIGKRDRIGQPFHARRETNAEQCSHSSRFAFFARRQRRRTRGRTPFSRYTPPYRERKQVEHVALLIKNTETCSGCTVSQNHP